MGQILCVEFQRHPLKFHNILPIHWKIYILCTDENLRALRLKSSYIILKCPLFLSHLINTMLLCEIAGNNPHRSRLSIFDTIFYFEFRYTLSIQSISLENTISFFRHDQCLSLLHLKEYMNPFDSKLPVSQMKKLILLQVFSWHLSGMM